MLTDYQKETLCAYFECSGLYGPSHQAILDGMNEDYCIENPDADVEDAISALSK